MKLFAPAFLVLATMAAPTQTLFADTYTIDFTKLTGTGTAGTGSFDWNGAAFSNFNVSWASIAFNFTTLANNAVGGAQSVFQFLTTTNSAVIKAWAGTSGGPFLPDSFTFTAFNGGPGGISFAGLVKTANSSAAAALAGGTYTVTRVPEASAISELMVMLVGAGIVATVFRRRVQPTAAA